MRRPLDVAGGTDVDPAHDTPAIPGREDAMLRTATEGDQPRRGLRRARGIAELADPAGDRVGTPRIRWTDPRQSSVPRFGWSAYRRREVAGQDGPIGPTSPTCRSVTIHGGGRMAFLNRTEAGRRLAGSLLAYRDRDVVVLGLPRGGVPVAYQVARILHAPLDVLVVRKLGVPFQPELAMGAVGEDGARVLAADIIRLAHVSASAVAAVEARERADVERRAARLRAGRASVSLAGRTAIIVDDGIATGSTVRAACRVARSRGAARVVVAVPVGPPDARTQLGADADELVCLESPTPFYAVGEFYADFSQTTDAEVADILERAAARPHADLPPAAGGDGPTVVEQETTIPAGERHLAADLRLPAGTTGIVVFAHGSGSSRFSPRNRQVAATLNEAGLGTLLLDLLEPSEELNRARVFDIPLLAERLAAATAWLRARPDTAAARIGYFGASTGAAAALWGAAEPGADIAAIVSCGGRPDLAGPRLAAVRAPTLLIVGGHDTDVLALNRQAQARLTCESRLRVVPVATRLFEETGTLERVADLAQAWFLRYLAAA